MDRQGIVIFNNHVLPTTNIEKLTVEDDQISIVLKHPLINADGTSNNALFFRVDDKIVAQRTTIQILEAMQKSSIFMLNSADMPSNLNTIRLSTIPVSEEKGIIKLTASKSVNISDIVLLIPSDTMITMYLKTTNFVLNCGTAENLTYLLEDLIRSMHSRNSLKIY